MMRRKIKTRAEADDAIAVLTADHRQVRALFHRYEATHEQALKWRIAAEVFTALERHRLLEDPYSMRRLL